MTTGGPRNVAASVRQRLLNLAKGRGEEMEFVLVRYGIERLLYRLSVSPHAEQFVLKGATLFTLWEGSPHRATRDLDLLGFGDGSVARVAGVFRDLCGISVPEDGLAFDPASVRAEPIRTVQEYGGVRTSMVARLAGAVVRVQSDVGFGDAVTAARAEYPTLLADQPRAWLRVYPMAAVVAEKVHAIVTLGMPNTRMKDYFDLDHLAARFPFAGPDVAGAIAATFARRSTAIPADVPVGFTPAFGTDATKRVQWAAFGRRVGPAAAGLPTLESVVGRVAAFVVPPLSAASDPAPFRRTWPPAGPWC